MTSKQCFLLSVSLVFFGIISAVTISALQSKTITCSLNPMYPNGSLVAYTPTQEAARVIYGISSNKPCSVLYKVRFFEGTEVMLDEAVLKPYTEVPMYFRTE